VRRGHFRAGAPFGYDMTINGARPVPPGVNFSYTGPDWFGPLPPMQSIAPPEVAGRVWDFVPGYNLNTTPRPYEEILISPRCGRSPTATTRCA
jgi:hypothetical protein